MYLICNEWESGCAFINCGKGNYSDFEKMECFPCLPECKECEDGNTCTKCKDKDAFIDKNNKCECGCGYGLFRG